jgi:hypothetical protein
MRFTPPNDAARPNVGTLAVSMKPAPRGLCPFALQIGEEVSSAIRAVFHRPSLRTATAVAGLSASLLSPAPKAEASIVTDGTTRAQQTAVNPHLEGFFASGPARVDGDPTPYNLSATHLWGQYYAVAAHEVTNGISIDNLCLGRDYINNPGTPVGISRIDISPNTDFAIITANTADNSSRDPNSRIAGIAVAVNGSNTIYARIASQANLEFINQVTGSNFTIEEVLAGQTIFAVAGVGSNVWSQGYGAWGTPSTGLHNPDGLPGQWQAMYNPNGGLGGIWSDPSNYFATSFFNSGDLNGLGASIDSGSPGIVIVPEPGAAGLLIAALAGTMASRRRRENQSF